MPKRILHIEDDAETAARVKSLLEKHGCLLSSAFSGRQGLSVLSKDPFDMVLLDVMLPDMTGWDVFWRMRETFHNEPVAFLSVVPISDNELNYLRDYRIYDYIKKPFNETDLVRRILEIVKTRKSILHIDSDPEVRVQVKTLLEYRGYDVRSASNAKEGLAFLDASVNLLLIDAELPDLDCWSFLEGLRRDPGNQALKVAFLSSLPLEGDMRLSAYSVEDHMRKPFVYVDFVRWVDRILA